MCNIESDKVDSDSEYFESVKHNYIKTETTMRWIRLRPFTRNDAKEVSHSELNLNDPHTNTQTQTAQHTNILGPLILMFWKLTETLC